MQKYCPRCSKRYPESVDVCPDDRSNLVPVARKDLVGDVIDGRYAILGRVGEGGMGVVYRAEHLMLKRVLAVKVLRKGISQDEQMVKRFMTEARAIASLDSRHTVTVHDFGVTDDGLLYYTMEMLEGRVLSRIFKDEAPLEPARAVKLIRQACESLKEAHAHSILHRDIKADNLFVCEKDGEEIIKVLDFGIAKLLNVGPAESITLTGMIIGTPNYLSPEQAMGGQLTPASDLYSLAVVLFEMLSGKPPFCRDTPTGMVRAHVSERPPALCEANPDVSVPPSVERFLARALQKDPANRFVSAVAFSEALGMAMEDPNRQFELVEGQSAEAGESSSESHVTRIDGITGESPQDEAPSSPERQSPQDEAPSEPERAAEAVAATPMPAALTPLPARVKQREVKPLSPLPQRTREVFSPSPQESVAASQRKAWALWSGILALLGVVIAVLLLFSNPWDEPDTAGVSRTKLEKVPRVQPAGVSKEKKAGGKEAGGEREKGAVGKGAQETRTGKRGGARKRGKAEADKKDRPSAEGKVKGKGKGKPMGKAEAKAEAKKRARAEAVERARAEAAAKVAAAAMATAGAESRLAVEGAEEESGAGATDDARAEADVRAEAEIRP